MHSHDRSLGRKLDDGQQRCTNALCDNPEDSHRFFAVDSTFSAGKRDWATLVGQVLCHACYSRYRQRGTLERVSKRKMVDTRGAEGTEGSTSSSPPVTGVLHVGGEKVGVVTAGKSFAFCVSLCSKSQSVLLSDDQ